MDPIGCLAGAWTGAVSLPIYTKSPADGGTGALSAVLFFSVAAYSYALMNVRLQKLVLLNIFA